MTAKSVAESKMTAIDCGCKRTSTKVAAIVMMTVHSVSAYKRGEYVKRLEVCGARSGGIAPISIEGRSGHERSAGMVTAKVADYIYEMRSFWEPLKR